VRRPLELLTFRPATEADLPACEAIWREGLNGYLRPLGVPDVATDNPGLRRLHTHTLATDPARFLIAAGDGGEPVGFGSAIQRGPVWFLSMLFVKPDAQARGLGRAILDRILPSPLDGTVLATVTDSAQPISNALYASLGIGPRVPMFNLLGRPKDGWRTPALPEGIRALPEDAADTGFVAERDALDRAVLGYDHDVDHRFAVSEGRHVFAYRDAAGGLAGYGYASEAGRVGPIAVRDAALLAPVVAHLLVAIEPRGASSVWLAGAAGDALRLALDAGLRIDAFPLLVCWSAPFVDLARYVPISPGLL
jgi:ribosomal protein S18 acetylase RimI-like enzyme